MVPMENNTTYKIHSPHKKTSKAINPWFIAIIVMIPTFVVVLNTSIANVALPNIAASFAISTDDATWVLTGYLVANGIILPSTLWFCNLIGRKNFLMLCTAVFAFGSILCGFSVNLPMMVLSRVIQGLGGGALMPIAQSILLESFPHSKRGSAMALFGIGVMAAPIIGPTLGGWITDNYSWKWIFFINVPISILGIVLAYFFVQDPVDANRKAGKLDVIGFMALIIWLVSQQIILDKGQRADWFGSAWVCQLTFVAITFMIFFIVWELFCKNSIVDLQIFKDRNFTAGCIVSAIQNGIVYGTLTLLPLFLQHLIGYTATSSGAVMTWRGLSLILMIILYGYFANKLNTKFVISLGFFVMAVSFVMFTQMNLSISMDSIIYPNLICGIGLGLMYTPLTTITFETLHIKHMANGAGIYNLIRSIGGSIGISITNTLLNNYSQIHQNYLVANLHSSSLFYQHKLSKIHAYLSVHMDYVTALHKANYSLYKSLVQQASLLSYMDVFAVYAILSFILVPTVIIFRTVNGNKRRGYKRRKLFKFYIRYKHKLINMIGLTS